MRNFTSSQADYLQQGHLSLEMLCALLNNNVDAYAQSLEFTEHVQARGAGGYASLWLGPTERCIGLRVAGAAGV